MSDKPQSKNLIMKLCEVVEAVERIPKNGWNDFHKYQYVMEADLIDAVRGELAKRHIMILPSMTKVEHHLDGKGKRLTTVEVSYDIEDGESGEKRTVVFGGAGEDAGDKGIYKAFTGSQKYMLQKTFQIPTGDDPERENNGDGASKTAQDAPKQSASLPTPPPKTKRAEKAQERAEGRQQLKGKLTRYSFQNGYYGATLDSVYIWTKDEQMGMMLRSCDNAEVTAECSMTKLSSKGNKTAEVFKIVPDSMTDDLDMSPPEDEYEAEP